MLTTKSVMYAPFQNFLLIKLKFTILNVYIRRSALKQNLIKALYTCWSWVHGMWDFMMLMH